MLELVQKYQAILGLLKVSSISGAKLQSVLRMIGYEIDAPLAELAIDILKGQGEALGTNSVLDVLKDKSTQIIISDLIASKALDTVADKVLKPKSGDDSAAEVGPNWDNFIHKDTMIRCAHCNGILHIRSIVDSVSE